ncbi:cysteinyl-tRNA synthetase [Ceratobasidium sp. 428]|nr:cysteinyl-tRNA synthetase [Ceratobasidium sp. 428]
MAQANRWGNGNSAQISHSWGQDPAESAGDSSLIAPWLDDGPESGPSRQATLEPPSPPATKRSFLSSKTSLHSASLRTMQHQPSIGSISLFKSARPSEPVISDFGTLAPPAPMGHGEVSPSTSKKPKGILLGLLKRKTSRANVRPGSAGGDEESYSTYSQSTLSLAGPSNSTPNILPPSPPANSHAPKKKAKTSRARAQPQPVAEFTLDTNLDEMDGIIARPGPQYPPWHDDASDGSHMSNIVGPTGMTGVQSPTAAFFTDPFSANVFPASPRSTGTGSTIIARQIAEPPLQANGHRPGSPTAGVGPSSGIVRNIPSPTLPRSDWAAPESWAVDGTGPKEEDYSSESDDGLAPSTHTVPSTSLPGRSDSLAGSINTARLWKPPGSAGSGANRDGALNGGAFNGGAFGRMGADIMSGGASTRGDRRLNSAGSMRSYAPTLVNGIGAAMAARGSEVTVSKGPSFNMRVYRTDGTYHVVSCPLHALVGELQHVLSKKLGLPRESHRLHLWERNRERALGNHEKPALIMRRRLDQAGYDDMDQLETIGGEDLRFLLRFVYRSVDLGGPGIDEEELSFDTFERVDLTGRGLQTVPILLHRHASTITFLNLSKNPLVDLPLDFIQGCDELRELRLSTCSLKRIPASVQHSTSLHWLDLSCNRIVDLENAGLDNIPDLRTIKLQNNRLTSLPSYFAQLNTMRYLNISNNKLDVVPPVICEMRSLVDLDMSFNSIIALPDGIGSLTSLERLVVVGNQITGFPEEISMLEKLKWVDCRRNAIADLAILARVPNLVTLRADHNSFLVLDLSIGRTLNTLEASFNSVTRFTLGGSDPYVLTSLDLSHAKLSGLDEAIFDQLPQLINLRLDYNKFKSLPASLGSLTLLQHLSCTNNDLASLPDSIGALQKLRRLNVRNNNVKEVPVGIWYCEELQEINCSSNLLQVWPDPPVPNESNGERKGSGAGLAEGTTIIGASASNAPVRPLPLALSLQRLLLADNQLLDDVFHPLAVLRDLRVLNLSFNQISEMPSFRLQTFAQLEELYLSGNRLTSFPADDLERLQKLNVLFLNANKLQTLPAELRKVKKLTSLDVGSNVLKYNMANFPFDWNWDFNRDLRYLNLSGNKRLVVKPLDNTPGAPVNSLRPSDKQENGFAVLRDIRVLGLIDATVIVPSVPDESDDRRVRTSFSEINGMAYGISDSLGKLEQLNMFDLVVPHFRGSADECLFGIFGRAAPVANSNRLARYLHENFSQTLLGFLKSLKPDRGETTPDALRRTFLSLNKTLYDYLLPPTSSARKMSQASTVAATKTALDPASLKASAAACVVYFVDKMMYVANAGSSLAVVSRHGTPYELSRKHDPFDRVETTRIRAAEGWVSPKGLVNDEVECDESRGFGAYHLLPAVNARPDVQSWQLTDLDEFVIIGNRGLWDFMDPQTAVDIVRDSRARREEPMISAQTLRDHAISYGAEGNTMVMVISVSDKFTTKAVDTTAETSAILALKRPAQPRQAGLVADRTLNRLGKEIPPPVGQIALVFTDIRNSTSLWEKNPGMSSAMRTHNSLLRRLLRLCGGYEVKTEGDAFIVSFQSAPAALLWCFNVQIGLCAADWPIEILESEDGKEMFGEGGELLARGLSVRMGIHWGAPLCEEDPITGRMDYFGPMVNRSARVSATAIGGEIMISADALKEVNAWLRNQELLNEAEGEKSELGRVVEQLRMLDPETTEVGERRLKGLEVPELLTSILPRQLAGRWKLSQPSNTPAAASRVQFNVEQIRQLGTLCARLEALSSGRVFRDITLRRNPSAPNLNQLEEAVESMVMYANPALLMPDIRKDASDEELMTILDSLSLRIENALGNIQHRQISGYDEVLAQLGVAIRLDPNMLMQALVMFQGVTGAQ